MVLHKRGYSTRKNEKNMNKVFIYCEESQQHMLPIESLERQEMFKNIEFCKKNLYRGKGELFRKMNGFNSMGQNNVCTVYMEEIILKEETNMILILTDNTSRNNIRGFALLNIQESQMELIIICVNKRPNVRTRSNINYGNGSMLLNVVTFLGKDFRDGIKTNALNNMVAYYYKFGWRFISSEKAKERSHIVDVCNNLLEFFKRTRNYLIREKEKEELVRLLFPLRGSLKDRARIIRNGKAIGAEATYLASEDGYQMLLPQSANEWNLL